MRFSATVFCCCLLLAAAFLPASDESPSWTPRHDFGMPLEPAGTVLHGVGQSDFIEYAGLASHLSPDHRPAFTMAYLGIDSDEEKVARRLRYWAGWLSTMPADAGLQLGLSFTVDGKGKQAEYATDVAAGVHDQGLIRIARGLAELERPVWVRIGYECNGFWNGYQPETYVPAFRHIASLLREHGGDQLATVWCVHPMHNLDRIMQYYPGDEWVDWWSIDLFQTKFLHKKVVRAFCQAAAEHDRPILIGEATPAEVPRDRQWEQWFQPLFELVHSEPAIKGLSYINRNWRAGRLSWGDCRVHTDPDLLQRYQTEIAKPLYHHAQQPVPMQLHVQEATIEAPTDSVTADDQGRLHLLRDTPVALILPVREGLEIAWLTLVYRLMTPDGTPAKDGALDLEIRDASGAVLASQRCQARDSDKQIDIDLTQALRAADGPLSLVVSGELEASIAIHGAQSAIDMPPQLSWATPR